MTDLDPRVTVKLKSQGCLERHVTVVPDSGSGMPTLNAIPGPASISRSSSTSVGHPKARIVSPTENTQVSPASECCLCILLVQVSSTFYNNLFGNTMAENILCVTPATRRVERSSLTQNRKK
eukprot:3582656-Rhodomonas_salina.2